MKQEIKCNCCGIELNTKNEGIVYYHKGCIPFINQKEQTKGLIMRDMLKALFKANEIRDKEQFISDFDELLDDL